MSILSDSIKVQIHVANRKLNALEGFTAAGQLTTRKMLILLLQAEVTALEKLLEGTNLGDLLEGEFE